MCFIRHTIFYIICIVLTCIKLKNINSINTLLQSQDPRLQYSLTRKKMFNVFHKYNYDTTAFWIGNIATLWRRVHFFGISCMKISIINIIITFQWKSYESMHNFRRNPPESESTKLEDDSCAVIIYDLSIK